MITYQVAGPNAAGDYLIAYATPGMPHVLTVAGVASCEHSALAECQRRNDEQVVGRRAGLVHVANFLAAGLHIEQGAEP